MPETLLDEFAQEVTAAIDEFDPVVNGLKDTAAISLSLAAGQEVRGALKAAEELFSALKMVRGGLSKLADLGYPQRFTRDVPEGVLRELAINRAENQAAFGVFVPPTVPPASTLNLAVSNEPA